MMLVGSSGAGTACANTWLWSSASRTWSQGPRLVADGGFNCNPNAALAMTFDEAHRQAVLFVSATNPILMQPTPAVTMVWNTADAGAWVLLPDAGPLLRAGPALAYEADLGGPLMYGGFLSAGDEKTLLRFDTRQWVSVPVSNPLGDGLPPPSLGAFAWQRTRHRMLYIASPKPVPNNVQQISTWELSRSLDAPGGVFIVPFDSAGIAPETVLQISVDFVAGADSEPSSGARLVAWLDGAWRALDGGLDSNLAPAAAAAPLQLSVSDPQTIRHLLTDLHQLSIAVLPLGINGASSATVSTSYAQVRVHYRLP